MLDVSMVGSALSSVKTAYDIAKGMAELSKDVDMKLKAHEMLMAMADVQGKLLETQQALGQMQDELRQAKEDLERRADFDRYELVEPYQGTRLYRLKQNARIDGEPMHYICPRCKDTDNIKAILQEGAHHAYCRQCKSSFATAKLPSLVNRGRFP
jgi:hypothetical protein